MIGGWVWLPSLPTCDHVHISLEILTISKDIVILFSGTRKVEEPAHKISQERETSFQTAINDHEAHEDIVAHDGAIRNKTKNEKDINAASFSFHTRVLTETYSHLNFEFSPGVKINRRHDKHRTVNRRSISVKNGAQDLRGVQESRRRGDDMMALELRQGRPHLLLDLGSGIVRLALKASYSLADNTWHRIDLIWKEQVRSCP